jgi:arsenate reductase (thioredoxin)
MTRSVFTALTNSSCCWRLSAGRSQMALGFFTHYAGDRAVAWSGGSEPGEQVNPAAGGRSSPRPVGRTRPLSGDWRTGM